MATIKTDSEVDSMRKAGQILAGTLLKLRDAIQPGASELDLDILAHDTILAAGGKPAFLNYFPEGADRPFPNTLCTSVNEVIVHGVPSDRRLSEGDIITLDLGVIYKGLYADAAITFGVGLISKEASHLIQVTEECLSRAIEIARPENTLGDIGAVISDTASKAKLSVVKGLTGHGIGRKLHEEPTVFNEGKKGAGITLEAGMTLAIEPMLATGSSKIVQMDDDSYVTADGGLAAQFEHTIYIGLEKTEILTKLK